MPWPLATATTLQKPDWLFTSRAVRSATCSCMSATSSRDALPASANSATAPSGSSVCTCTRRVRSSPTTSTLSPIASSSGVNAAASSLSPVTAKLVQ